MSRAAFYTGTVGGIIGFITAGIGLIWCIYNMTYISDIYRYVADYYYYLITFGGYAYFFLPIHSSDALFSMYSMILAILLIVSGVLTGIGFFGVYRVGGGSMGIVGLATAIAGSSLGALLIYLGIITKVLKVPTFVFWFIIPFVMWTPAILTANFFYIWVGLLILAITFIMLGASSIAVREMTGNSTASMAAGVLSIIGGCFFFPYVLVLFEAIGVFGCIFALVGFGLILVAFILWAVVFFSSRNL